jgi:hypothetical protein
MGEYYEYIAGNSPPHGSDSKTTGLESSYGYHCILCAATIVLESALWAKCGLAEFSEPFPWVVVFWWCVFGTIALHHDLFYFGVVFEFGLFLFAGKFYLAELLFSGRA